MLNKKILILGGNGMLGKDMVKAFHEQGFKNITFSTREKSLKKKYENIHIKHIYFDINSNLENNLNQINKNNYDFIINCIGIVKPRIQEKDIKTIEQAIIVNSLFPHKLRKFTNQKTKIFQIATDCVFSGLKGNYDENSSHDAIDTYGKSKSLGEVNSHNFFNIRSSIIGLENKYKYSLLEWFLTQKNKTINGFINHDWNGLSTIVFSNLICSIIINKIKIPNLIHLTPKNIVNKYELLLLFENKFRLNANIKQHISNLNINRTLRTNHQKLINQIWKTSIYKKKLSIFEIVNKIN